MGYELYREVKRYAPADLDTGELALLLILADDADEDSRECSPGIDELCAWMRMSSDGISKILQRLAKKGIEVRIIVDKDKIGRPVYARKGLCTTYLIPSFAPAGMVVPASDQTANGRTTVRPKPAQRPDGSTTKAGVRSYQRPPKVVPQYDPSSSFPEEEDPPLPPALKAVRDARLGLDEEEEDLFIAWANHPDQNGPHVAGWWAKLAKNGDLAVQAARWRNSLAAAAAARDSPAEPVLDPWCRECGDANPICETSARWRTLDGTVTGEICPVCHPDRKAHS